VRPRNRGLTLARDLQKRYESPPAAQEDTRDRAG
jgi:hypothetical protein